MEILDKSIRRTIATGEPTIRFTKGSGTICFSKAAMQLLKLEPGSGVIFGIKEKDVFIKKEVGNKAFIIRTQGSGNKFSTNVFNSADLVKKIHNHFNLNCKSVVFKLSNTPSVLDGIAWFLLITNSQKSY